MLPAWIVPVLLLVAGGALAVTGIEEDITVTAAAAANTEGHLQVKGTLTAIVDGGLVMDDTLFVRTAGLPSGAEMGRTVFVEGMSDGEGGLVAERVIVGCPSRYEPAA